MERVLKGDNRALSYPLLNGDPGTVGILSDPGLPSVYERKSPSSSSLLFAFISFPIRYLISFLSDSSVSLDLLAFNLYYIALVRLLYNFSCNFLFSISNISFVRFFSIIELPIEFS